MYKKILLFLVCVYFLIGCQNANSSIPTPSPEQLDHPLPEWLIYTSPNSEEVINHQIYEIGDHVLDGPYPLPKMENGICVHVWPILEPGDFFSVIEEEGVYFPDRVSLFIDGELAELNEEVIMILGTKQLKNENHMITANTGGPYIMYWNFPLAIGTHTAIIQLERTSGIIESYSWSFTLSD